MFAIPKILDRHSWLRYLVPGHEIPQRQKPQAPHLQDGSSPSIDHLPNYKPLQNKATRKIINHWRCNPYDGKAPYSRHCYYCWYGYSTPRTNCKSTTFKCVQCDVLLFKPSKGQCWELHLNGLPKPRYKKNNKRKYITKCIYVCTWWPKSIICSLKLTLLLKKLLNSCITNIMFYFSVHLLRVSFFCFSWLNSILVSTQFV